jgi:hypothetical protein
MKIKIMSVTKDGLIYCRKTNIRKKGLKDLNYNLIDKLKICKNIIYSRIKRIRNKLKKYEKIYKI